MHCQNAYCVFANMYFTTLYKILYLVEPLWKRKLPLDGSKCHLFHLLTIHTAVVGQITHMNPCKQEIVRQEK